MMTRARPLASVSAMARPMRLAPPVTRITRPWMVMRVGWCGQLRRQSLREKSASGLGITLLELLGHLVDGLRKILQRVTLAQRDALAEVPAGDGIKGGLDSVDGADDPVALADAEVEDHRDGNQQFDQERGRHGDRSEE